MKIWGIGANWGDKSMLADFQVKEAVGIGWSEKQAPALYAMMNEIEIGDIVYVKSFVIHSKELKIKAVGEVISNSFEEPNVFGSDHRTVHVKWKEGSFDDDDSRPPHRITQAEFRYNVYLNTLYREYNPKIIEEVLNF